MNRKVATSIYEKDGNTIVKYHNTEVVIFNDNTIILNTGGWQTATTNTRMNQASIEYNLNYKVIQRKGKWFVTFKDETLEFIGTSIILQR